MFDEYLAPQTDETSKPNLCDLRGKYMARKLIGTAQSYAEGMSIQKQRMTKLT